MRTSGDVVDVDKDLPDDVADVDGDFLDDADVAEDFPDDVADVGRLSKRMSLLW